MTFVLITLLAALSLAAVADWFSIIGFMTIYAASPMHALIMGIVLALAKLVTTSWVYRNWKFTDWKLKSPLIGFVIALMVATSIGTYGFLTKSHLDQGGGTIDNGAKVERLEQQIAREKSVIVDDEKVIAQLDNTINSYIGKDRTDKSLAVRRSQAPQRKQLRDDIDASQKRIDTFSDERLKLQSEVRKQQLDVGPIRYIAELFYGVAEDATKNIEAAVRIFTLLITSTLDPLAVILLVAANHTLLRIRDEKEKITSQGEQPGQNKQSPEPERVATSDKEQCKEIEANTPPPEQVSIIPPMERTVARERTEENAIPISILPEAVVSLDEEENTHSTESNILSEHGDTVADVPAPISIHDAQIVKPLTSVSTDTPPPTIPEVIYEEKETILERPPTLHESPPLSIIRSPRPTRVSIREVAAPVTSDAPEVETPVHTQVNVAVPKIIQNSVLKDFFSSKAHFIPQKVNEEEKHTQIETQSADTVVLTDRTPTTKAAPSYEKIFGEGQKISKEEAKVPSTHKGVVEAVASHKYPVTLSWLTEFKRS